MPENTDIIDADVREVDPRIPPLQQSVNAANLAVVDRHPMVPTGLFAVEDPDEFIERASKAATALAKVLKARQLVKKIGQNEYVEIGGWQLLGGMVKVYCSTEWTRKTEDGWEARAVCHNAAGDELSSAEAQCSTKEQRWSGRDDFQVRSMAQTRAQSKAYRTALGFIVELAGYKATPAEEMSEAPYLKPRSDGISKQAARAAGIPTEPPPAAQASPPRAATPKDEPGPLLSLQQVRYEFRNSGRSDNEWDALLASHGVKPGGKISRQKHEEIVGAWRQMVYDKVPTLEDQAAQAGLPLE